MNRWQARQTALEGQQTRLQRAIRVAEERGKKETATSLRGDLAKVRAELRRHLLSPR